MPLEPPPFARQLLTYDELTDLSPSAHRAALERFVTLRPHAPWLPPSREGTIVFPGFDGGAEWGGAAVDPRRGILYVNGNEMPWVLQMVETRGHDDAPVSSGRRLYAQVCAACHGSERAGDPAKVFPSLEGIAERMTKAEVGTLLDNGKGAMPPFAYLTASQKRALIAFVFGEEDAAAQPEPEPEPGSDALGSVPYAHTGYNRWLDEDGHPAIKPPWGTLNAIDLNSGEFVWRVPLGEVPALTARGVPPTGTENYGGPLLTAGGLLFIAASKDERFRAFDQATGRVLWETQLPAGGYATPATYLVNGRQYVVIACGGGKMGTRSGDAYVAFALPP